MSKSLRIFLVYAVLATGSLLSVAKPKSHPVKPTELLALIDRADGVAVDVLTGLKSETVYSSTDGKDLSELKAAISVDPAVGEFRCLCMPSARIHLHLKKKELATVLIYPDGMTIGFAPWSSDAKILDQEKWLRWFDVRRISGPRKGIEEQEESEKRARAEADRWMAGMPASLRPVWLKVAETMFPGQPIDTKPVDAALVQEFPDMKNRVRALMSWFGSGAGPWSGFPSYESVAEEILLEYPTAELLAAAQEQKLSETEMEGAARLFARWDFNQRRPEDNRLIPSELKRSLLEHSLKSDDKGKLDRARQAFQ